MLTKSFFLAADKVRVAFFVLLFLWCGRVANGQTEKELATKLENAGQFVLRNDAGDVESVGLNSATDAFVESIDFGLLPHLRSLSIISKQKAEVTDRSLIHIRKKVTRSLAALSIDGAVSISGKELGELLKARPSIEDLALNGPEITDKTMLALTEGKNLTRLTLLNPHITDEGLKGLTHCENLRSFQLGGGSKVTNAGMEHIIKLPKLSSLILLGTKITDGGLKGLADCESLRALAINNAKITDAGLEHFKKLPDLLVLELSRTEITDKGLLELRALENLRSLNVSSTKVTAKGKEALQKLLPDLKFAE